MRCIAHHQCPLGYGSVNRFLPLVVLVVGVAALLAFTLWEHGACNNLSISWEELGAQDHSRLAPLKSWFNVGLGS